MTVKVGINGFGRIGRQVLKAILDDYPDDIKVVAVNDLFDAETNAHLLRYDSNYGKFPGTVEVKDGNLLVNGREVKVFAQRDPAQLPWGELGVQIVVESTGVFRQREKAALHLQAGAKKVIISAPAKGEDITIVLGVNEEKYDPANHHIISNASCTTNCLAPVAKVLLENFGIHSGLMTTVHAYTGDQRLLDFPHKDLRRARAAALSMIPTSTGAARAVALVLPELAGKLNGLAIRVPTPNVSIVDFVACIEKSGVTVPDVNAVLKSASASTLAGILGFSELPLVSIDFNGSAFSSIVDAPVTHVVGNLVKILAWYDNEVGYSNRMIDLAAMIGAQP